MPIDINNIDIISVIALCISIVALVATLRKKEYGVFYFIPKKENRPHVWIKLIKSDVYDVKFSCEPYKNMNTRIDLLYPESNEDSVWDFISETNPSFEFGSLSENTIVKFRSCDSRIIHITFRDKYNNYYKQTLTQNHVEKRYHKNFWNLTFVGS